MAAQQSLLEIFCVVILISTQICRFLLYTSLDKTLFSVYTPPNSSLSLAQLPTPFITIGNFNRHNPLCCGKTTITKVKQFKTFSPRKDYVFSMTALIYIYHAYLSLLLDFSRKVNDDLSGSDISPLFLKGYILLWGKGLHDINLTNLTSRCTNKCAATNNNNFTHEWYETSLIQF